ncbi:MAG: dehydratase [Rhizobiales bacterium]|nr:dehydratase [Hyphomicrobiales bacterium]
MSGDIKELLKRTIGRKVSFRKTVSESDVYGFAGITGDFAPNHIDEEFMKTTSYGRRIAHGALMVGFMSRASSMIVERCPEVCETHFPVSAGYDRVRFVGPVFIGDTITVSYAITDVEETKLRTLASVHVGTPGAETVAVATHIMTWLPLA